VANSYFAKTLKHSFGICHSKKTRNLSLNCSKRIWENNLHTKRFHTQICVSPLFFILSQNYKICRISTGLSSAGSFIIYVGLQEFDGRGNEEQFLNWYIRNKVVSIMMYGKKPPKCTHLPFTPIRFDYVSPDELAEVNELFYSDGEDD
jgi:hypothetical protein